MKYIAAVELDQNNSLATRKGWRAKASELDLEIRQYTWLPNVPNV